MKVKQIENFIGKLNWSTTDIDWSDLRVRDKTLTANETWTFSNLAENLTISVYVTGDYAISLPTYVNIRSGTYDGTVNNAFIFHCLNATSGSEKVICKIESDI